MKKIETIAAALIWAGILGVIFFSESLETSLSTFATGEAVSFAVMFGGIILSNKKTEAEASAHTMSRSRAAELKNTTQR